MDVFISAETFTQLNTFVSETHAVQENNKMAIIFKVCLPCIGYLTTVLGALLAPVVG